MLVAPLELWDSTALSSFQSSSSPILRTLELSLHWGPELGTSSSHPGVHLHPPQFAKFGHRAGPHLSQIFSPGVAGPTSEVRQRRGLSLSWSHAGDHDFLRMSLSSLSLQKLADRSKKLFRHYTVGKF